MNYYTVEDIKKLTGLGRTASYDLLNKLNRLFAREYKAITIKGKIPKWYFEKKMMIKEIQIEKEN